MMSISDQEQQALAVIEAGLRGSGPELAAKLAIFTRLAAGEVMPPGERLRPSGCAPPAVPAARAGAAAGRAARRRLRPRLSRRAVWPLVWVTAAIAMLVVALVAAHGAGEGICAASLTAACQQAHGPAPAPSGPDAAGTGG